MHGLKKDVDLKFLDGREMIQVAIGLYQVSFAFDGELVISVEAQFVYSTREGDLIWRPEPGFARVAAKTVSLLGSTITGFENSTDGTLVLVFSNGERLTITDANREFESYNITYPGHTIVV